MEEPDPYDIGDEQAAKRVSDDYELPLCDKRSLEEIRKKIKSDGYKTVDETESHQEFLEGMSNRLLVILQNEKRAGKVNWELERQIEEIKVVYFELERIRRTKAKQ